MSRRSVVLLGPALHAVSGVSTHVRQLLGSDLAQRVNLWHFQVGSEGRAENAVQRLVRFITSPLALAAAIVRHRADIVHLNTSLERKSYWRDVAYVLVTRMLRRRIVFQVHGGFLPQEFVAGNFFSRWILRQALQRCDVVVVLAQVELLAYRRFAPRTKVVLIPNAIEPDAFASRPRPLRASEPLRLAYLGRIVREKGVFEAVSAMQALAARGVDARLSIAGSGPDELSLRQMIEQAGVAARVRLLAPVYGAAKYALWAESDVFVFPTYHREGLPYALLESMAAGAVPVVCPVAAVPDVVEEGVSGLFVPPRDPQALTEAICRLDGNRLELMRMGQAARDRAAANYSIAKLVEHFTDLYESM